MKKYKICFSVFVLLLTFTTFNIHSTRAQSTVDSSTNTSPDDTALVSQFNTLYKPTFKIGIKNNDVKAMQKFLKDQEYYSGKLDGKYGKITARAVKDFADDYGVVLAQVVTTNTVKTVNTTDITQIKNIDTSLNNVKLRNGDPGSSRAYVASLSQTSGPVGTQVTVVGSGFSFLYNNTDDSRGVWISNGSYSTKLNPKTTEAGQDSQFFVTIPTSVCPGTESVTCSSNFSTGITPGIYSIYVKNFDGASNAMSFTVTDTVMKKQDLMITTDAVLPNAQQGQPYSVDISGNGGTYDSDGFYKWTLVSGYNALPSGLDSGFGAYDVDGNCMLKKPLCLHSPVRLHGTPTTAGVYTFQYNLTSGSQSVTKEFTLVVNGTPVPPVNMYDVNGDGQVTMDDYKKINNAVMGLDNTCDVKCDLNKDGLVNVSDLQLLTNYLTNNTTPKKSPAVISSLSKVSGPSGAVISVAGTGFDFLFNKVVTDNQDSSGVWISNGSYSTKLNPQTTAANQYSPFSVTIPTSVCPGTESVICSSNFSTGITPGVYSIYVKNATGVSNVMKFTVTQ